MQRALLWGLALCLALLLLRAGINNNNNKDSQTEGPAGHFPPMLHRKAAPEAARGSGGHFSRAHNPEAIARAKGGTAAGGKSNLAGQIIPVYGFGILLYILYIIFKITSKGKTIKPHESRFSALRSENMKRKITDFELMQLQERLKETEEVMERIVSRAQAQRGSPDRVGPVSSDQEEALLLQLREITRVMQEGRLVEGFTPQRTNPDPQYDQDLEDCPGGTSCREETREWHQHRCRRLDHQSCRFQHGEADGDADEDEDGGERRADGGTEFVYSKEDVIAGDHGEDEEPAEERVKDLEDQNFHRLSSEPEGPCRNAAGSGSGLMRRRARSEAVRGT